MAAEEGAGTLVHVGRFDLAEFAVVLEPEEPLRTARRTIYAGLAALADALAAHAPPEKPIDIVWPDAIARRRRAGRRGAPCLAGRRRLRTPPPPWLVFAAMIRTVATGEHEPGLHPFAAALDAEGLSISAPAAWSKVLRAISWLRSMPGSRTASPKWPEAICRALPRKPGVRGESTTTAIFWCDRAGKAGTERRKLAPALAQPSWLDPATGAPRQ